MGERVGVSCTGCHVFGDSLCLELEKNSENVSFLCVVASLTPSSATTGLFHNVPILTNSFLPLSDFLHSS